MRQEFFGAGRSWLAGAERRQGPWLYSLERQRTADPERARLATDTREGNCSGSTKPDVVTQPGLAPGQAIGRSLEAAWRRRRPAKVGSNFSGAGRHQPARNGRISGPLPVRDQRGPGAE